MTGFLFDASLSSICGVIAAIGYMISYFLAKPILEKISGVSPVLYQDLTDPSLYLFKAIIMVFSGFLVGVLSTNFRKLILNMMNEQKEKQYISKLFGQFVSTEVKDKIVNEKASMIGKLKMQQFFFRISGHSPLSVKKTNRKLLLPALMLILIKWLRLSQQIRVW